MKASADLRLRHAFLPDLFFSSPLLCWLEYNHITPTKVPEPLTLFVRKRGSRGVGILTGPFPSALELVVMTAVVVRLMSPSFGSRGTGHFKDF